MVKTECANCGRTFDIWPYRLRDAKNVYCDRRCMSQHRKGTKKYLQTTNDMRGKKYGMLTVIEPTNKRTNSQIVWECLCDCGKTAFVITGCLQSNSTKSCGCLYRRKREEHPNWRGGKCIQMGYEYTNTKDRGWVKTATLVLEKHLGRRLLKGEFAHHKNGDKLDDRIENLELTNRSEHAFLHYHKDRQINEKGQFV